MQIEPDAQTALRERSRAVWDAMASAWEAHRDAIWDDSRSVGEWLVERLKPRPGDLVLELAAGAGDTGRAAARLVGNEGCVLITDFAPEMVAAARRRAAELGIANAEFRVLDAEGMDLDAGSFDGVICRWGYMLMVDPAAAFAETRRVLRPGGRLAFSVWGTPADNPWASLVGPILAAKGLMAPPDPSAPGIFALADSLRVRALVGAAGFSDPEIEDFATHRTFADFDVYWRYLTEVAGAISPVLRALSPQDRADVRDAVRAGSAPHAAGQGYDFPGRCLNAVTW